MSFVKRGWVVAAATATLFAGAQLTPALAPADPEGQPQVETPPTGPEVLHNIIYRARVDGVSRGATITYAAEGDQTQTANPTMVPGRIVDINTVLPASGVATMKVQVKWPYSANLHCEILVDDQLVAQADDFVAPRLIPNRDDPDFGSLSCQAPVTAEALPAPVDPAAAPPADAPAPPA
ncbi:hypothetical protein H7I41_15180 [Mycobacterium manitobense]|uniref:Uncharacterized protein n=1 Tax=[Mycobacterium] manitobense TaxID=190147 RepID=A0A9X3BW44_9MYCO|nr:hypothetical protein [[Mycobacterium] manitobense]MCV7171256.1 hypothetical protein [[Mycobacterium] manitobense]